MFTRGFWKAATERAIKTVAQTGVALLTVDVTGLHDVDWPLTASAAGLAGLVSILTSLGFGLQDGTPSAGTEVPTAAVAERVDSLGQVIAGPANDFATPGALVRRISDDTPDGQVHYRGEGHDPNLRA